MFTRFTKSLCFWLGCFSLAGWCGSERMINGQESRPAIPQPTSAQLLLQLPPYCNTPDGMALLPDGDIILSMPNFNELSAGAFLVRISPDNEVSEFLKLPDHPQTGQPVGPLGVCVSPTGDLFLADYQMTGERQSRVLRIVIRDGQPAEIQPVITGFHVSNAVICHGDCLYVSETQIDTARQPATSGVFTPFGLRVLT